MSAWAIIPGVVLVAASYAIQFGSVLRRPRPFGWVRTAIRLRFTGFGMLFLGPGLHLVLSSLLSGLEMGSLAAGLVVVSMAGTWFYAASDPIFRGRQDGEREA